jgi:hypothetical protein
MEYNLAKTGLKPLSLMLYENTSILACYMLGLHDKDISTTHKRNIATKKNVRKGAQ